MASAQAPDYPGVLPPPPGITPNIDHPESAAWKLIVAGILCPVFAIIFWSLRHYTTLVLVRRSYVDDWLIVASLVLAIGLSIVDISQTRYGMCTHMWETTPDNFQRIVIVGIPASVFYNLSTLFVKASILSFYLRFAAANRPFRIAVYTVLFVITGYSLNAGFSFLYLCNPIHKLWDGSAEGTCVDLYTAFLVSSVLNAVTDVIILLLPIWLLWPLRVKITHKILVALVLMPGGFVCAVSFLRLASIPDGANDPDTTWRYCDNNIWCLVELYVGIICACLPSLKAFATHFFPGLFKISPYHATLGPISFRIPTSISGKLYKLTTRSGPSHEDINATSTPLHTSNEPPSSPSSAAGSKRNGTADSALSTSATLADQASIV